MALLAHDAQDRVDQLLTLTKRLTDLIERETTLFVARRPLEAAPFRDEKAKLANIYRQETARIRREPSLVAGARAEDRTELAAATERLTEVLDEHAQALNALKEISEGLVKSIADHVMASRTAKSGYGPTAAARDTASAGAAITLNQVA